MPKRFAALFGAALLAALPARADTVRSPDTFVYVMAGDVDSLDPAYQYDGSSIAVLTQIYEPLVFYRGGSLTVFDPIIASKVPSHANGLLSRDGRVYTFPIRKGLKFHNGSTLTPEDVKYSLLRFCLMDRDGGPSSLLLDPLLGIEGTRDASGKLLPGLFEALDKAVRVKGDDLVITLKTPYAPFLSVLAGWAPVVSRSWAAAHGDWDGSAATWERFNNPEKQSSYLFDHEDGTGPFRLERWDKENKEVDLTRFDDYWSAPAKLKTLVFRTIDEFSTKKLLLESGDADAVFAERQYEPELAGLPGVTIRDGLPSLETTNCFVFNFKVDAEGNPFVGSGKLDGDGIPPAFFADPDVRKGFAYAFDYAAYIRDGYRGKAAQARGPIPRGVFGYNPAQPVFSHDPALAAAYLKKAFGGQVWDRGFRFTLAYEQGRADRQLACDILKRNVEALNPKFSIDIRPVLWSTYLDLTAQHKLPLANARWGMDFPDPHNSVVAFLHSQGNYPSEQGYKNPKADALIEKAVREQDPARRKAMYYELQRIAYEDVPDLFTVDIDAFRAQRSWVKHWDYNAILPNGYFYQVSKGD